MKSLLGRRVGVPAAEWGETDGGTYWGSVVQLGVDTQGKECVGIQLDGGHLFHWPTPLVLHWLETQPMIPAAKRARVVDLAEALPAVPRGIGPRPCVGPGSTWRRASPVPVTLELKNEREEELDAELDLPSPAAVMQGALLGRQAAYREEEQHADGRPSARGIQNLGCKLEDSALRTYKDAQQQQQQVLPCSSERHSGLRGYTASTTVERPGGTCGVPGTERAEGVRQDVLLHGTMVAGSVAGGQREPRLTGASSSDIDGWQDGRQDFADASCVITLPEGAGPRNGGAASLGESCVSNENVSAAADRRERGESRPEAEVAVPPSQCVAGDGDVCPAGRDASACAMTCGQLKGGLATTLSTAVKGYLMETTKPKVEERGAPEGPAPTGEPAAAVALQPAGQSQASASGCGADSQPEQAGGDDVGSGIGMTGATAVEVHQPCLPPLPPSVDARPALAPVAGWQQTVAGASRPRQHKLANVRGAAGGQVARGEAPTNGASAIAAGIPLGRCIY